MSRVGIMQDIPAHICWRYLHGGLRKSDKTIVESIVCIAIPNSRKIKQFIREIAYRTGYARSSFINLMSEGTYKQKKQWCRDLIVKEFAERIENDKD